MGSYIYSLFILIIFVVGLATLFSNAFIFVFYIAFLEINLILSYINYARKS